MYDKLEVKSLKMINCDDKCIEENVAPTQASTTYSTAVRKKLLKNNSDDETINCMKKMEKQGVVSLDKTDSLQQQTTVKTNNAKNNSTCMINGDLCSNYGNGNIEHYLSESDLPADSCIKCPKRRKSVTFSDDVGNNSVVAGRSVMFLHNGCAKEQNEHSMSNNNHCFTLNNGKNDNSENSVMSNSEERRNNVMVSESHHTGGNESSTVSQNKMKGKNNSKVANKSQNFQEEIDKAFIGSGNFLKNSAISKVENHTNNKSKTINKDFKSANETKNLEIVEKFQIAGKQNSNATADGIEMNNYEVVNVEEEQVIKSIQHKDTTCHKSNKPVFTMTSNNSFDCRLKHSRTSRCINKPVLNNFTRTHESLQLRNNKLNENMLLAINTSKSNEKVVSPCATDNHLHHMQMTTPSSLSNKQQVCVNCVFQ